jgi:hypothetical protein
MTACGGSAGPETLTKEGQRALGQRQWTEAKDRFDEALGAMPPEHKDRVAAQLGRIEANAHLDPVSAKREFLEFASASPGSVDEDDFIRVGWAIGEAGSAEALDAAIEVAGVGKEKYAESTVFMSLIDKLGDLAARSDDPAAMSKLQGLGYAGK